MRRGTLLAAGLALACAVPATAATVPPLPLLASGATSRVSVGAQGAQAYGVDGSLKSAVSPDGRYVAFTSYASGLAAACTNKGGVPGGTVYLRDRTTGATELISRQRRCLTTSYGGAQGDESSVSVSANGRCVAFVDVLSDVLKPGERAQIVVRDRLARRTIVASVGYDGHLSNSEVENPAISADCSAVAFETDATNILSDQLHKDFSGVHDVYVRDLRRGRTERVGPNVRNVHGEGWDKYQPSIGGNGRYVAFVCAKPDLVKTKTNPQTVLDAQYDFSSPMQMYVYDRTTRKLDIASVSDSGYPGNADVDDLDMSAARAISADGRYVVFASYATNLVPDDDPVWTATGHNPTRDATPDVYRYDRLAHHITLVSTATNGVPGNDKSFEPAISGDGRWVAYTTGASNLGDADVTPVAFSLWWPFQPGDDATVVGYDVYLWDAVTGTNRLISRSTLGVQGDRYSFQPTVNSDGSVVSYTSRADNLVDGDTNGLLDVFAYVRSQTSTR